MSEQIITKKCSKCKQIKPLSDFSKHSAYKNGYRSHCKICRNKYGKIYRQIKEVKERNRKNAKKYYHTDIHQTWVKKYIHTKQFKESQRRYRRKSGQKKSKEYRNKYPKRVMAGRAINYAVSKGRIPPAKTLKCHYCPQQAKQYHHYLGYAKEHWLDVMPACCMCHVNIHKKSPA